MATTCDFMCDEWTLVPGWEPHVVGDSADAAVRVILIRANGKASAALAAALAATRAPKAAPWHPLTTCRGTQPYLASLHTLHSPLRRPVSPLTSPSRISQAEEKLYTLVEHVPVASFKELETKVVEDMGDDE